MKTEKTYIVDNEENIGKVAALLYRDLKHKVILFIGELGAGKTTFIKALLKTMGSADVGSSPSFSIINAYNCGDNKVYHVDLYRLDSPEEAFQLGIEEYLYSGDYCFIEWPQLIYDYIEPPYHIIRIDVEENYKRKLTLMS